MSDKVRPSQFADRKGIIVESFLRNIGLLAEGAAVPADGTAGYEEGAIYILRNGPAGGSFFINQGTQASCLFRPSSMAFSRQVPGVAAAVAPGATGADNVVGVITLPANFFTQPGQGLYLIASGIFAANANTKRVKLWFNATTAVVGSTITGGTLLADTGAVTTSGSSWLLEGAVFKRGAAGANTQTTQSIGAVAGSTAAGLVANVDTTAVETASILCAVTINNTTTATDAVMSSFEADSNN